MKKSYGALYWLLIIFVSPLIFYFGLAYVFGHSSGLCLITLPSGLLVIFLWIKLRSLIKGPTEKWDWDESSDVEINDKKKPSSERYSLGERSDKKRGGIFSRIFSREERCEKCGNELVYKEGAGSYYCPECQEYRWR